MRLSKWVQGPLLVPIWQCLTWLGTELDFNLKAVSYLNWKNAAKPTSRILTDQQILALCNWYSFLVWNQFWKFQTWLKNYLPDNDVQWQPTTRHSTVNSAKINTVKAWAVDCQLVAHFRILRLFIKGKFNAYVLRPLVKRVQNWIVDWFTAHNLKVCYFINDFSLLFRRWCKARAVCPAQHDSIFFRSCTQKKI